MSLSTFLKNKDVQKRFKDEFKIPRATLENEIQAPPLTRNWPLIGTAFDYLMRFRLEYINPAAHSRRWIAEELILDPRCYMMLGNEFPKDMRLAVNGDTHEWFWDCEPEELLALRAHETPLTTRVREITEQARESQKTYLATGEMSDGVIADVIRLAQLDPIFRAGYVDENIGNVDERDVEDLRNLLTTLDRCIATEPSMFKADTICELNPIFKASSRVDGADADLIIDRTLIDIKTTKKGVVQQKDLHQLIGYYVLTTVGGDYAIDTLAFYYSRFRELYTLSVDEVINQDTFPSFVDFFVKRAEEEKLKRRNELLAKRKEKESIGR
jgi:hypothetical protein